MRGRRVLSLVVFGATRPAPAVGVGGHPGCPLGHPGQGLRPWTLNICLCPLPPVGHASAVIN